MEWTIKGDGKWERGARMELRLGAFLLTAIHYGGVVACELRQVEGCDYAEEHPTTVLNVDVYQVVKAQRTAILSAVESELRKLAEKIDGVRSDVIAARKSS